MSNETTGNSNKIFIGILLIALIGSWIYFINTNNTKTQTITNFTTEIVRKLGVLEVAKRALEHLKDCDQLYISFDVDSLDSSISLGTGTPVPNGLTVEEAIQLNAELIKDKRVCCWEIVEVNPTLDSENRMAEIAFEVLEITTKSLVNHF